MTILLCVIYIGKQVQSYSRKLSLYGPLHGLMRSYSKALQITVKVFVTDEVINTDARKSVVMFEPLGVVLAGINAILFA